MLRAVGVACAEACNVYIYILFIIHDIFPPCTQHAWSSSRAFRSCPSDSALSILSQSLGVPQGMEVGPRGVSSRRD